MLIAALCGCTLILLVGHIVFAYRLFVLGIDTRLVIRGAINFNLVGWFYLDNEKFFGAIFSALLLFTSSSLMLVACVQARPDKVRMAGWALLWILLLYLAADEYLSIHERVFRIIRNPDAYPGAIPAWLPTAIYAAFIGLAVMMVPIFWFWWKLPGKVRLNMGVAGGVFMLGAVVVDELTSALGIHGTQDGLSYILMVGLEEGLEMLGAILLVRAMLLYLSSDQGEASDKAPLTDASA